MTELNDTWETKYNELKAQHDHLTHITEAKINKKAENFMENKIVDTENENSRLKSRVNELESELTQVNDENNTLHSRSEEHTSELQSRGHLVCRLLLEKKN